jgi:eukaryotic-like serine/threonine-protein kinase
VVTAAADPVAVLLDRIGHRLGPFHVQKRLGKGGFAPVYLADEVYAGAVLRTVAIKVFVAPREGPLVSGAVDPRVREALVEEARALCRVEHPNVVRFHQIVEDEGAQLLGFAMELVRGTTLADTLDGVTTLDPMATLDVGIAVASALSAVHRAGLIHRDVKPQNIVESDGVYKLIDFGIAAHAATDGPVNVVPGGGRVVPPPPSALATAHTVPSVGDAAAATEVGFGNYSLAGTMGYMDPTCLVEGTPAVVASDLYALGCTLYECLTGRLPACPPDGRAGSLLADVAHGRLAPPAVRTLAIGAPAALAELVDALVAPDRGSRPKSADRVVAELERIRRVEGGRHVDLPPESEGPFRGLGCFEPRHRSVFLGRSMELSSGLETLRTHGLLTVVGPSGSGKSSLARAAILPAVEDGALGGWPKTWTSVVASPGKDARAAILAACAELAKPEDPDDPDALVQALLAHVERTGRGIVLLVDQLEELVTQGDHEGRRYTATLLTRIGARPLPGLRAVVAVRRDFLDPLFADEELGAAMSRGLMLVAPVALPVWRDILDEGISRYGYSLDDDARGSILSELRAVSDAMPIVQFALAKLWERRDTAKRRVTYAALASIGGLAGALELHAEEVTARIVERHGPPALDALRRLTLALTSPQGTRLSLDAASLALRAQHPGAAEILAALEEARLVTREGDSVAFAHDAVIVSWRRLADWIREVRAERELAAELEAQAARFAARKERELLWAKRRLAEVRALLQKGAIAASAEAVAFVRASRRAELRRVAGGVTLASSLVVAAALTFGLYQSSEAHDARTRAEMEKVERDVLSHRANALTELHKAYEQLREERDACERARSAEASTGGTR